MRSLSSPSVVLWLEESVLCKLSASLEADGCCSSLFEENCHHRQSILQSCPGVQEQKVHRHEAQAVCWWYIRIHKCWFFLHGHTILNRGHHTEITVSTVISRHPPNQGHSKWQTTSFSIHPRIAFGWTECSTRVVPIFCTGPLPYSRNPRNMPFV